MDWRRECCDGLRGAGEERLDIGDDVRLWRCSAASCSTKEGSKGSVVFLSLDGLAAGTLLQFWLATGGPSLKTLGGGAAEDPSPALIGKTEMGLRCALGDRSAAVEQDVVRIMRPLLFHWRSCLLLE